MSTQPEPDELRIGTAERDESAKVLGEHLSEGRLTSQEYEQRVSQALQARTRAQLRPLFADLPAPHPAFLLTEAPSPGVAEPAPRAGGEVVRSDRSRLAAGLLQIVLPFGVGRFYTGQTGLAVAQLLCTLLTFGVGAIWSIIDGILLLVNGGVDEKGRPLAG
ncbi:protein of unknown function (DUF1707) [Saccharomonospora marina XMU15]|uniref:Uncharacterized protein n=1 Tax=Saccharomonospora marina XMU15 TaxID=882083 RepID=H5WWS0_9PSEU|nr:DUF1707 domain-containing protein [Saccharomonospora marina]EHR51683.1 protein of unknown function (DUF1707) [Saccharomonospora marina XMU15]